MIANITADLLKNLKPKTQPYDVRDKRQPGFIVRVNKSGKLVFMCEYGRAKRISVERSETMTLRQARDEAKKVYFDAANGIDPKKSRDMVRKQKPSKTISLNHYIEEKYAPWLEIHNTSGRESVKTLKTQFSKSFGTTALNEIDLMTIDEWRTKRLKKVMAVTINRNISDLHAALNQAVKWKLIETNPLNGLTPLKTEKNPVIRYLEKNEERRLRKVIKSRNEEAKAARKRTNEYRKTTNLPLLPSLAKLIYTDHIYPMILLSINTGIRRGELFRLDWEDIDFKKSILTAKSQKSRTHTIIARYIPLNSEALSVIKSWYKQEKRKTGPVFLNKGSDERFTDIKKSWNSIRKEAKLEDFLWHDFRHHFASKLVMAGVDINTVRELMGHTDIKMTLRYAHLAPEHKAKAVEKIVR